MDDMKNKIQFIGKVTHYMGLNTQDIELLLVVLPRLGRIVRHKEDILLLDQRQRFNQW